MATWQIRRRPSKCAFSEGAGPRCALLLPRAAHALTWHSSLELAATAKRKEKAIDEKRLHTLKLHMAMLKRLATRVLETDTELCTMEELRCVSSASYDSRFIILMRETGLPHRICDSERCRTLAAQSASCTARRWRSGVLTSCSGASSASSASQSFQIRPNSNQEGLDDHRSCRVSCTLLFLWAVLVQVYLRERGRSARPVLGH